MRKEDSELSKEISYALRHAPWEYELELDEAGWVSVEQLIESINKQEEHRMITVRDIEYIVENSSKKRHEIEKGKIRALYGHSVPMKISKDEKTPPNILYHGTSYNAFENIKKIGILPMSRQYVHLSVDRETALSVGKRKDKNPIILEIDTNKAMEIGIKFYLGNEKVWLADSVPVEAITNLKVI